MELLVVDGAVLTPSDSNVVVGSLTLIGQPSNKVLCEGKGVLKDQYQISITNITYPSGGANIPDTASYTLTFSATTIKAFAEGNTAILREVDLTDTVITSPKIPNSGSGTVLPTPVTYKIENPNQTKVLSN